MKLESAGRISLGLARTRTILVLPDIAVSRACMLVDARLLS